MSVKLRIPESLLDAMRAQALASLPLECCGLIGGVIESPRLWRARAIYPLANALASPVEFEASPGDLLAAHRALRADHAELLAIYHSHPTSDPIPSRKDLERNAHGDAVAHLILSLRQRPPELRGWWYRAAGVEAAVLEFVPNRDHADGMCI